MLTRRFSFFSLSLSLFFRILSHSPTRSMRPVVLCVLHPVYAVYAPVCVCECFWRDDSLRYSFPLLSHLFSSCVNCWVLCETKTNNSSKRHWLLCYFSISFSLFSLMVPNSQERAVHLLFLSLTHSLSLFCLTLSSLVPIHPTTTNGPSTGL